VVNRTRCIGCGACEYKCLVNGEVAIRVYAPGRESILKAGKNHSQDLQDFFRIYKIFFQVSCTSFFVRHSRACPRGAFPLDSAF